LRIVSHYRRVSALGTSSRPIYEIA
jgi:hypothetical protein